MNGRDDGWMPWVDKWVRSPDRLFIALIGDVRLEIGI